MKEEGAKKNQFPSKTHVIIAAQGIQNPYSAEHYGRDFSKGEVNDSLLKNIEKYVEKNKAELNICAVPGAYVNEIELDSFFHYRGDVYIEKNAKKRLNSQREREQEKRDIWERQKDYAESKGKPFDKPYPYHFFWDEIPETDYKITGKRLNTNVSIVGIPEPSQNIDPFVRKKRFTTKYGGNSIIIPSTKQKLQPVATGQAGNYPRLMIATGCLTKPNYNTTNRTGFLANEEHEFGFCVVDVLDDKLYLPRLVPAQSNGTFIDLGMKYADGKNTERVRAHVLVLGDAHVSELDFLTDKANDEMIDYFNPKFIHIHDVFNSRCINSHELDDEIAETDKVERSIDSLEEELFLTGEYLSQKAKLAKHGKIIVNYSNHDDMLYRWLSNGGYRTDKKNRRVAHKILGVYQKGDSILETALRVMEQDIPHNIKFLKLGEDAIYWGYQCGMHGHKGKNGAQGSLKSLMEDGKIIIGHVHQLEINQGSGSVGTSSKIPLEYQLGQLSTSMAGNIVIYEGGLMQGLPIIRGRWKK